MRPWQGPTVFFLPKLPKHYRTFPWNHSVEEPLRAKYGVAIFPMNTAPEDAPLSGVVFKIEKEAAGEKIAYVRVFAGRLNVREPVAVHRKRQDGEMETRIEKVKKLHLFSEGKTIQVQKVEAGEFCKVWGLKEVKIGEVVGEWSDNIKSIHFAEPQMETRIEAQQKEKKHELYQALKEMSEEDPLIKVLEDTFHNEIYMRIFGEVQKEVIGTMLKENYGLDVWFSETRVVCIEKPGRAGQAVVTFCSWCRKRNLSDFPLPPSTTTRVVATRGGFLKGSERKHEAVQSPNHNHISWPGDIKHAEKLGSIKAFPAHFVRKDARIVYFAWHLLAMRWFVCLAHPHIDIPQKLGVGQNQFHARWCACGACSIGGEVRKGVHFELEYGRSQA